jgi:microcystin-dependent protein
VDGQTGFGYVNNVSSGVKRVLDDSVIHPFIGGGQAHNNMMPSTAINFIICTAGLFPQRS